MKNFDPLTFDEWWELDQTKGIHYMDFRHSTRLGEYVLIVTSSRSIGRDRVDYIIEVKPNRHLTDDEKSIFKDRTVYDPNDENEKLLRKWTDPDYNSVESLREWYNSNIEEAKEDFEGDFEEKYFKKNRFDPEAESSYKFSDTFTYSDISKIFSVSEVEEWLRAEKMNEKLLDFPNSKFIKKLGTPFLEDWLRRKKVVESPTPKDFKRFKTPPFKKWMADNGFFPCPALGASQLYLIELYSTLGDFELHILEISSSKENCKSFEITMGRIRTNYDEKNPNDLLYYNKISDVNIFTKEGWNALEEWYLNQTKQAKNKFLGILLEEYFGVNSLTQPKQHPSQTAQTPTAQPLPPEPELTQNA